MSLMLRPWTDPASFIQVSLLQGFPTSKVSKLSDWSSSFSESSGDFSHASTLPRMSSLGSHNSSGQSELQLDTLKYVMLFLETVKTFTHRLCHEMFHQNSSHQNTAETGENTCMKKF